MCELSRIPGFLDSQNNTNMSKIPNFSKIYDMSKNNKNCQYDRHSKINFQCDNNIQLEPRLQEYIKKKNFYRANNMETEVSFEKEFCITDEDLLRIKYFLKGEKNIYNYENQGKFIKKASPCVFEDPDKLYKSDPRYQKILKKVRKDKEANNLRKNYGKLNKDYEKSFNPITVNDMSEIMNENEEKYLRQKRINSQNIKKQKPKDLLISSQFASQNDPFLQRELVSKRYTNSSYEDAFDVIENPDHTKINRPVATRLFNQDIVRSRKRNVNN